MNKITSMALLILFILAGLYWLAVISTIHEAPDRAKVVKTKNELKQIEVVGRDASTRIILGETTDSFDEQRPYKILILEEGKILAYSFGPDRDDDRCAVSYSPSNGTQSSGDIYREVVLSAT